MDAIINDRVDSNGIACSSMSINSRCAERRAGYAGDRWTFLLVLSALTATFGFAVPAGYGIGVLNTPVKILQDWCNGTLTREHGVKLSNRQFDIFWSLIVSVFLIGAVIGGITGGWISETIGRKGTLIAGNSLNFFAALMFICSKYIPSVELFFCARIIVGYIAGLMTTVIPMYLTELSPPRLCSIMGILFPVGLTLGIVISQIMGLDWLLGTVTLWPFLISFYGILSTFAFFTLPFLPESPKYLFQVKKEHRRALSELARLRNLPEYMVSWEIHSVEREARYCSADVKWTLIKVLKTRSLYLPLFLVIALQAGQQFSGINAIFYYSSHIFNKSGVDAAHIPYANIGTGSINFIANICSLLLVNKFSRRRLLIISCFLTFVMLILLSLSIRLMTVASWVPYMSIVFVLLFVLVFDLGLGPIPYFIGAELVEIGPRCVIMGLGSVANWGGNFIVALSYSTLEHYLHEYVFLLYAVAMLQLIFLMRFFPPETNTNSDTNHLREQAILDDVDDAA